MLAEFSRDRTNPPCKSTHSTRKPALKKVFSDRSASACLTLRSIYDQDRPRFIASMAEAMESLADFHLDYRMQHSDGTFKWLQKDVGTRLNLPD